VVREQCKNFREFKTTDKPNIKELTLRINEFMTSIIHSWSEISDVCNTIFEQRKQFFEEMRKFDSKSNKLALLLNKLEEDSYIFSVPGKFPEAYMKTIDEL
jgi:hypothetical protein